MAHEPILIVDDNPANLKLMDIRLPGMDGLQRGGASGPIPPRRLSRGKPVTA